MGKDGQSPKGSQRDQKANPLQGLSSFRMVQRSELSLPSSSLYSPGVVTRKMDEALEQLEAVPDPGWMRLSSGEGGRR